MIGLKKLLNKILNCLKVDYIIEMGQEGIGTYRKGNSGIAECGGETEATISFTTASGGTYQSAQQPGIAYPVNLFINNPMITLVPISDSGYLCWPSGHSKGTNLKSPNGYLNRGTTVSNLNYIIKFYALGEGK